MEYVWEVTYEAILKPSSEAKSWRIYGVPQVDRINKAIQSFTSSFTFDKSNVNGDGRHSQHLSPL